MAEIQRADQDGHGRLAGNLLDPDRLPQVCLGIAPDDPVDLDRLFPKDSGKLPVTRATVFLLPLDLDEVPQDAVDPFHILRVQAGQSLAHVFGEAFDHFEFQGPIHNGTLSRLRLTGTIILGMII